MLNLRVAVLFLLATILMALLLLPSPLWSAETEDTAASNTALTVSIVSPERQDWPAVIPASGWLKPWQEAVIAAEIGGQRVEAINADVGSHVAKGEVLAQLTSASIENDIAQQKAQINSDQAALDQATADVARTDMVSGTGAISQQSVTEYKITERKARATLAGDQAKLASYQLQLSQTKVVAVDDGVISSRSAALGDVVSSGTEMFRLIRQDRIEWQAEVAVGSLPRLAVGDRAVIPTPSGKVQGTIRVISPSASTSNGRAIVYVALGQSLGAPAPRTNIFVSGRFELTKTPALTLPESAIVLRDGFSYVFTIAKGNTVSRQKVETGRRRDDRVEIPSGLDAAARVVKAGGAFLSDGATVTVVPDDAATSGTTTAAATVATGVAGK